jgi:hypothetical protein
MNHRTRVALDEERKARQEDVAYLTAQQIEERSRTVLAGIDRMVDAVVLLRAAVRRQGYVAGSFFGALLSIPILTIALLEWSIKWFKTSDDKWSGELAGTGLVSAVAQLFTLVRHVSIDDDPLSVDEAFSQVSLAASRIRVIAHPDVRLRVEAVLNCSRDIVDAVTEETWPGRRTRKAVAALSDSMKELREKVATGPLV